MQSDRLSKFKWMKLGGKHPFNAYMQPYKYLFSNVKMTFWPSLTFAAFFRVFDNFFSTFEYAFKHIQ